MLAPLAGTNWIDLNPALRNPGNMPSHVMYPTLSLSPFSSHSSFSVTQMPSLLTPVHVSRNDSVSPNTLEVLVHPNVITISTAFDWNLDVNKKFCYSKANEAEQVQVMERERCFTLQAKHPISIEAFEVAVSCINFFWKPLLIFLKA